MYAKLKKWKTTTNMKNENKRYKNTYRCQGAAPKHQQFWKRTLVYLCTAEGDHG
jgi:hypothetical protein